MNSYSWESNLASDTFLWLGKYSSFCFVFGADQGPPGLRYSNAILNKNLKSTSQTSEVVSATAVTTITIIRYGAAAVGWVGMSPIGSRTRTFVFSSLVTLSGEVVWPCWRNYVIAVDGLWEFIASPYFHLGLSLSPFPPPLPFLPFPPSFMNLKSDLSASTPS